LLGDRATMINSQDDRVFSAAWLRVDSCRPFRRQHTIAWRWLAQSNFDYVIIETVATGRGDAVSKNEC